MNTRQPNWDDAASKILTVVIPLFLKAGKEDGVSLTDLGAFRKTIASIIRTEGQGASEEPA